MKLLAVDASGQVASVAIMTEEGIRAEYTVDYKKTHSQTLLPMIDEICKMTETEPAKLDAIAVSQGPGSFTGLRIGAATVKGMAFALDKPVIAIPTLQMLAANFHGANENICPMMDARRNQVYTGIYRFQEGELLTVSEQKACAVEDIISEINRQNREVILLGDGSEVYRQLLTEALNCPFRFAAPHLNRQRAGSLAVLAWDKLQRGEVIRGEEFELEYLRLSQAERELLEKAGNQT